eukprot:TRINITY_DN578_c0_g1_i1.p2 TRINITY_DN578_c0_g1~~TRINITY_DN578_c0_g1_i1.p2  ORF type:complete len:177 (-),score=5.97 TRINITY_DN578_c0_g1_i1:360-890(-)
MESINGRAVRGALSSLHRGGWDDALGGQSTGRHGRRATASDLLRRRQGGRRRGDCAATHAVVGSGARGSLRLRLIQHRDGREFLFNLHLACLLTLRGGASEEIRESQTVASRQQRSQIPSLRYHSIHLAGNRAVTVGILQASVACLAGIPLALGRSRLRPLIEEHNSCAVNDVSLH